MLLIARFCSGDQLSQPASLRRYQEVLAEGCRCIELSVWDNRSDGEPCVMGSSGTMERIAFRDVLEVSGATLQRAHGYSLLNFDPTLTINFLATCTQIIAEFGFKASSYPVILSLDNHCSAPYQLRMVHHLKQSLLHRGLLWLPPESRSYRWLHMLNVVYCN